MQAPPLVCIQYAVDEARPELVHVRDPACKRAVQTMLGGGYQWVLHNAAFDMAVIMAQWPDLIEPVYDLYDRDEVTCTILIAKLCDIARGRYKTRSKQGYGLDAVAGRLGLDLGLNKNDPWRLRYGTLIDTPVDQWPTEAKDYALNDAIAQRLVYKGLVNYAADRDIPLVDQFRQARAGLWLRLMECRGIMIDLQRAEKYIENVREALAVDRETCLEAGIVRSVGSKDTDAAMRHMVKVCRETDEDDIPVTEGAEKAVRAVLGIPDKKPIPKGATWTWWDNTYEGRTLKAKGVSLNEDSVSLFGDELLESYQRYSTATNQLSRAERLYLAAKAGVPVQASFDPLKDTGRTSCSQGDKKKQASYPSAYGAQLQNPAKDKKVKRKDGTTFVRVGTREMYIARAGHVLCPTDIDSAELCAVAQVCIREIGHSRLGDMINEGRDMHTELAANIGGMSIVEAYALRKGERGKADKDQFDNTHRQSAKIGNFGYWGNMGPAKLALSARKQYGVILTLDEAKIIKEAFKTSYTEFPSFVKWAKAKLTHMPEYETEDLSDRRGYFVQHGSGRLRGDLWLAALMNTTFQGLVADLFKDAGWRVSRECYVGKFWDRSGASPLAGSYIVNEVHDELITELIEARAHEAAYRQAEIVRDVAKIWAPDVRWGCKPALCRRWFKGAEEVFYADGRLAPWEPGQQYDKRDGRLFLKAA
jgi:hypothetical protein